MREYLRVQSQYQKGSTRVAVVVDPIGTHFSPSFVHTIPFRNGFRFFFFLFVGGVVFCVSCFLFWFWVLYKDLTKSVLLFLFWVVRGIQFYNGPIMLWEEQRAPSLTRKNAY